MSQSLLTIQAKRVKSLHSCDPSAGWLGASEIDHATPDNGFKENNLDLR